MDIPKNSSVSQDQQLHAACKMLEQGHTNTEVVAQKCAIDKEIVESLKTRSAHSHITMHYNFM